MSDEQVLTREILQGTRIPNKLLKLMLEEAKLGEKQLEDIKAIGDRLKQYAVEDYNTLDMLDKKLHNKFNYSNAIVQATKEADDKLMLMEGWAPRGIKNVTVVKAEDVEKERKAALDAAASTTPASATSSSATATRTRFCRS